MNYIIEDNIDIYAELANTAAEANTDSIIAPAKMCLITGQLLTANFITLPCKHTFNYLPLYKEVCIQKQKNNIYEIEILSINQMRCPYCRTKFDKILPMVSMPGIAIMNGVNYPNRHCMAHLKCHGLLTSGKNVGQPCGHRAFVTASGAVYCEKHSKRLETALVSELKWTEEMAVYAKKYGVFELRKILRGQNLTVSGAKKDLVKRIFTANSGLQ